MTRVRARVHASLRSLLCAALLATMSAESRGQAVEPGADLTISILTFGQGDQVWERFGHNAIRVRDTLRGIDITYNWGTFDFNQPRFIQRFLTGNTLYWLDVTPADLMIDFYRRELNRTIIEQRLELTPAQRAKLAAFLAWNVKEENRYYRYDYYLDNCSTRLRDAIDLALEGTLRRSLERVSSAHTFRSESLRLTDGMTAIQAGMHIALGEPADRPMTAWEESFVPMRLRDRLRDVRVPAPNGLARPLVAEERVLYTARRQAEAVEAPTLVGRFLIVGLLLAAAIAFVGHRAVRGARIARPTAAILIGFWAFMSGLLGAIVSLAWLTTRHIFWYQNENLFQLLPIALVMTVFGPLAIYRERWRKPAFIIAAVIALASVIGLVAKPLPMFEQRNLAVVLLGQPVHAAVTWVLWKLRDSELAASS